MNIRYLLSTITCATLVIYSIYPMVNTMTPLGKIGYAIANHQGNIFNQAITELEQQTKDGKALNLDVAGLLNLLADQIPSRYGAIGEFGMGIVGLGASAWFGRNEFSIAKSAYKQELTSYNELQKSDFGGDKASVLKAQYETASAQCALTGKLALGTGVAAFVSGSAISESIYSFIKRQALYPMAVRLVTAMANGLPYDATKLSEKSMRLIAEIEKSTTKKK